VVNLVTREKNDTTQTTIFCFEENIRKEHLFWKGKAEHISRGRPGLKG
jgi:hypothetical protein